MSCCCLVQSSSLSWEVTVLCREFIVIGDDPPSAISSYKQAPCTVRAGNVSSCSVCAPKRMFEQLHFFAAISVCSDPRFDARACEYHDALLLLASSPSFHVFLTGHQRLSGRFGTWHKGPSLLHEFRCQKRVLRHLDIRAPAACRSLTTVLSMSRSTSECIGQRLKKVRGWLMGKGWSKVKNAASATPENGILSTSAQRRRGKTVAPGPYSL